MQSGVTTPDFGEESRPHISCDVNVENENFVQVFTCNMPSRGETMVDRQAGVKCHAK